MGNGLDRRGLVGRGRCVGGGWVLRMSKGWMHLAKRWDMG